MLNGPPCINKVLLLLLDDRRPLLYIRGITSVNIFAKPSLLQFTQSLKKNCCFCNERDRLRIRQKSNL